MFSQIFDKFDTSLNFNAHQTNSNKLNAVGTDWVVNQSLQLWDLWVKESVFFNFLDRGAYTLNHSLECLSLLYNKEQAFFGPKANDEPIITRHYHRIWGDASKGDKLCKVWEKIPNYKVRHLSNYDTWFTQFTDNGSLGSSNIYLPYTLLTRTLGNISEQTDVVTAAGLETLEMHEDFKDLEVRMIPTIGQNLSDHPDNKQHREQFLSVLSAISIHQVRSRILSNWPGWTDMFESKDSVVVSSRSTVQSFVNGSGHNASEYERFCTALAYNINTTGKRVKLPKGKAYKEASDLVRAEWPKILQATNINDRLPALSDLMVKLREILSQDKDSSKPTKNPPTTNYNPTIDPEEVDYKEKSGATTVEAKPGGSDSIDPEERYYNRISAVTKNVEQEVAKPQPTGKEHDDFMSCFTRVPRKVNTCDRLREEAANAVWYVASPPPAEHGQLSGTLDEGALHRFAGWQDPHIFDSSPDHGPGQVAIAVLVDCSGSMNGQPMGSTRTFLDAILTACKRKPNVHVHAFGFASGEYCELLHVTNPDHVGHLNAGGGTPTNVAIQNVGNWLESTYPTATRGMVVLTDGEPCGSVYDPRYRIINNQVEKGAKSCANTPDFVKRAIRELPFPVIGVGFGGATERSMSDQFGPANQYMVSQPTDALRVICDVLQSATV